MEYKDTVSEEGSVMNGEAVKRFKNVTFAIGQAYGEFFKVLNEKCDEIERIASALDSPPASERVVTEVVKWEGWAILYEDGEYPTLFNKPGDGRKRVRVVLCAEGE